MKRILLLVIAVGFVFSSMAQLKPYFNSDRGEKMLRPVMQLDGDVVGLQAPNTTVSSKTTLASEIIMQSFYDLQTNSSMQHRFYRYDDGSMAGIATMSHENDFNERGTGYNYYDGTAWGPQPAVRIEGNRTGWPAYAPLGPNGEIVVAHSSATEPLYLNKRDTRGTGTWTQTEVQTVPDASGMLWCRMVTSGTDRMNVHIIALTSPVANGGVVWNDMDGALVYNRSTDGGDTWDGWEQLDGMTSAEYLSFGGDAYAWAEPHGNTIAFVMGDSWNDQFIMKSTDNGTTWTKTIVWDCPFDLWTGGDTTGDFRSSDGCSAIAIGPDDKVHVLFGLTESNGDETGAKFYFPWRDGLIYWNEDMPELPQDLDPDELFANGNYIGWVQDTNVWYVNETQLAYYYNSFSSIPTLVVDDLDRVFALWSGMTMMLDVNDFMLRHIFGRASADGGATWEDKILHVTDDFLLQWSEIVYISASPTSTDKIFFTVQEDSESGTFLKSTNAGYQGQMAITNNNITYMEVYKDSMIIVGIENRSEEINFKVSQNYPNPVIDRSIVNVKLTQPGNLSLGVYNVVGQKVMDFPQEYVNTGTHQFVLDGSQLNSGVYFYTVTLNRTSVTKKMIVN